MKYYIVQNKPVSCRRSPSSNSPIVNAYNVGTKIPILGIDSGWYLTEGGTYIFKTENLVPYDKWKEEHFNDMVMAESINKNIPKPLRRSLHALGTVIEQGSIVVLASDSVKDVNTGNIVPRNASASSPEGTMYTVTDVDGTKITILTLAKEGGQSTNQTYTVNASDLKMMQEGKWEEASSVATYINDTVSDIKNAVVDAIKNILGSTVKGPKDIANLDVTSLRTIFGIPYQFTPITDPRIVPETGWLQSLLSSESDNENSGMFNPTKIGRKYGEKIAARAPILIMQPGVADFMRGFNQDLKDDVSASLLQEGLGIVGSYLNDELNQMISTPGKFYTFKPQLGQYYGAVDQMCSVMAHFLGIENVEVNIGNGVTAKLGSIAEREDDYGISKLSYLTGNFTWENAVGPDDFGFHYKGSVAFYVNSDPQINESFSNQSNPNSFTSKINDFARMGSELQFLLGGAQGHLGTDLLDKANLTAESMMLDKSAVSGTGVGGLIDSVIDNIQVVMAGGRMIFPEMWTDSSFTRTYNVTIKLVSPDSDNLSIYLNILVPLAHILAFVLPRSVGMNNYISPFLVRAYYKSMFHIDMGLITSCDIQKGDVGAWSQSGLPTQITVSLGIKDLYNVISLATGAFFKNTITGNPGQIDYIANLCGINIDGLQWYKAIQLWWSLHNPVNLLFKDASLLGNQMISNVLYSIRRRIGSLFPGVTTRANM